MVKIKRRWIVVSVLLVAAVVFYSIAPKMYAELDSQEISPKGYYRLDFYTPFLWPASDTFLKMSSPGFVRFYDNRTGKLLGESDIVELGGNGYVTWPGDDWGNVRIGMYISFPAKPEPKDAPDLPKKSRTRLGKREAAIVESNRKAEKYRASQVPPPQNYRPN